MSQELIGDFSICTVLGHGELHSTHHKMAYSTDVFVSNKFKYETLYCLSVHTHNSDIIPLQCFTGHLWIEKRYDTHTTDKDMINPLRADHDYNQF